MGQEQSEQAPGPPAGHRRPTSPGPCATSCWSATPERARPRWSRPCSPRPAPITRAGRVEDGTTVTRLRRGRAPPAALGLARARPARARRHQGQPARHPRLRRLRRRPAGRPARRGRGPVRRLGGRRHRRRDPLLWEECAAVGMPRAVVITKLDKDRADFDEIGRGLPARRSATACCRCTCRWPPTTAAAAGLIGLLSQQRLRLLRRAPGSSATPDPEHLPLIETARNALIEGIIAESEDETLMDRYLGGEDIDLKVLDRRPGEGGRARLVLPGARRRGAPSGSGMAELLEVITAGFPSPLEHDAARRSPPPTASPRGPLTCDPAGPLVAEVVKTTTDPYVGRISLVRVFSGTLRPDATVHVSGPRPRPTAGTRTTTSTRRSARSPRRSARPSAPSRQCDRRRHRARSPSSPGPRPATRCPAKDDAAADGALGRCPTRCCRSPIVAQVQGRRGQAVAGPGAAGRRGPDAAAGEQPRDPPARAVVHGRGPPRRPARPAAQPVRRRGRRRCRCGCRCARPSPARPTGHGRHVKQSGGHGQFAVCDIEVEPLPSGARLRVRRQGRRRRGAAAVHPVGGEGRARPDGARASRAGYPVVDIRVTLIDGKAHSVDSSDMAFQTAGALALKEAAKATTVHLLEPVDELVGAGRRRVRRRGDVRPVGAARPGRRHRAGRAAAAPWSGPRCRSSRSPATPSTSGRCRTAPATFTRVVRPARADAATARRQAPGRHGRRLQRLRRRACRNRVNVSAAFTGTIEGLRADRGTPPPSASARVRGAAGAGVLRQARGRCSNVMVSPARPSTSPASSRAGGRARVGGRCVGFYASPRATTAAEAGRPAPGTIATASAVRVTADSARPPARRTTPGSVAVGWHPRPVPRLHRAMADCSQVGPAGVRCRGSRRQRDALGTAPRPSGRGPLVHGTSAPSTAAARR